MQDWERFLLKSKYKNDVQKSDDVLTVTVKGCKVHLDFKIGKIRLHKNIKCDHESGLLLDREETASSFMLLLSLLDSGYPPNVIHMEKEYETGRSSSVRVDFYLADPQQQNSIMIDAKSGSEFDKVAGRDKRTSVRQIISYASMEQSVTLTSFYNYDFKENKNRFAHIDFLSIRKEKFPNVAAAVKGWTGEYKFMDSINEEGCFKRPFSEVVRRQDLSDLTLGSIKNLKEKFLEILRVHTVSDKPGAFMVLVNIMLCKIYDERAGDRNITLEDKHGVKVDHKGMSFQYVGREETDICFLKRMQDLFKIASKSYLEQDVVDYSDREIDNVLKRGNLSDSAKKKIKEMFEELRLKRSNPFAFIDVYDDKTFSNNARIVKEVVSALQRYKFRYNFRQQFLGEFFEELLVTSIKQDEGQFFTPVPLVDFIVRALPIQNKLDTNLNSSPCINEVPYAIDHACGSGHFLISYMDKVQEILNSNLRKYKHVWNGNAYDWVSSKNIVGIEKDYRLARTSKVASFFNGDGEMCVVTGDGVNKFTCAEYQGRRWKEQFDFVISNPPFSVKGFYQNFKDNKVDENDFSLLKNVNMNDKNSEIEIFFVERAYQLLKLGGMTAILLPQSILTNPRKYANLRKFIMENFRIRAMLLTADATFFKTSTSPVTLFMEKDMPKDLSDKDSTNYDVLFMYSDKYRIVKSNGITGKGVQEREAAFLGYKFSNNQNVASIVMTDGGGDLANIILPVVNDFLSGKSPNIPSNGSCEIRKLKDVLLNSEQQIFPLYRKPTGGNVKPLSHYFTCDENTAKSSLPTNPYLEIGGISEGKIKSTSSKKKSGHACIVGDVLVAMLTPTVGKMCIADRNYVVSSAIAVLRRTEERHSKTTEDLLAEMKKPYVIKQMNALTAGFKVTYSKISPSDLMKHVYLKLKS